MTEHVNLPLGLTPKSPDLLVVSSLLKNSYYKK